MLFCCFAKTTKQHKKLVTYKTIDFRDWKNVDLLIYYFETGRADELKEALQLVDRQLQTNQITEAIRVASEEIGKTIHQSITMLGAVLAISFERLAQQQERMITEIREQSEMTRTTLLEQSHLQLSRQDMTNALLSKIEKSSAALADDMDRQLKLVHGIY